MYEENTKLPKFDRNEFSNRLIHIKYHIVKDYVDNKIICCDYCPSLKMIDDMLTMDLSTAKR